MYGAIINPLYGKQVIITWTTDEGGWMWQGKHNSDGVALYLERHAQKFQNESGDEWYVWKATVWVNPLSPMWFGEFDVTIGLDGKNKKIELVCVEHNLTIKILLLE